MDINEIKKYDDIVTTYKLSALIATNKSKGIWSGQQLPSDHLFQSWEQFASIVPWEHVAPKPSLPMVQNAAIPAASAYPAG